MNKYLEKIAVSRRDLIDEADWELLLANRRGQSIAHERPRNLAIPITGIGAGLVGGGLLAGMAIKKFNLGNRMSDVAIGGGLMTGLGLGSLATFPLFNKIKKDAGKKEEDASRAAIFAKLHEKYPNHTKFLNSLNVVK